VSEHKQSTSTRIQVSKTWESVSTPQDAIEWSVTTDGGLVQGPLDLEFLRSKQIALNLSDGQVALLLTNDEVNAVFVAGSHLLSIGSATGQLAPDGNMLFLATGQPIHLRWRHDSALHVNGPDLSTDSIPLIGSCTCLIGGPLRFYRSFLAGAERTDDDFLGRIIDTLVRSHLESVLDSICHAPGVGPAINPAVLQSRLTQLSTDELSEELDEFGLMCTQLAVYTATPPIEDLPLHSTGQNQVGTHN